MIRFLVILGALITSLGGVASFLATVWVEYHWVIKDIKSNGGIVAGGFIMAVVFVGGAVLMIVNLPAPPMVVEDRRKGRN